MKGEQFLDSISSVRVAATICLCALRRTFVFLILQGVHANDSATTSLNSRVFIIFFKRGDARAVVVGDMRSARDGRLELRVSEPKMEC